MAQSRPITTTDGAKALAKTIVDLQKRVRTLELREDPATGGGTSAVRNWAVAYGTSTSGWAYNGSLTVPRLRSLDQSPGGGFSLVGDNGEGAYYFSDNFCGVRVPDDGGLYVGHLSYLIEIRAADLSPSADARWLGPEYATGNSTSSLASSAAFPQATDTEQFVLPTREGEVRKFAASWTCVFETASGFQDICLGLLSYRVWNTGFAAELSATPNFSPTSTADTPGGNTVLSVWEVG
jgi:hypothetical protein